MPNYREGIYADNDAENEATVSPLNIRLQIAAVMIMGPIARPNGKCAVLTSTPAHVHRFLRPSHQPLDIPLQEPDSFDHPDFLLHLHCRLQFWFDQPHS